MRRGGMNLERMIAPQIQSIVPKQNIELHLYDGQNRAYGGVVSTSYVVMEGVRAQVQLTNVGVPKVRQLLEMNNYINNTNILMDFRIQSYTLTGLNRNIDTGGDYIKYDGLFYRIIAVPENFRTGWVWVIGAQGGATIESV